MSKKQQLFGFMRVLVHGMVRRCRPVVLTCWLVALVISGAVGHDHPILFVTQVPVAEDFTTVLSTFGNHLGDVAAAPRGGDLYILYPNGSLKNLTETAGYGMVGFQGAQAIAVRDPEVHWGGDRALFSMIIGASEEQFERENDYWQIYEITGLGMDDTPGIRKVPNQPENHHNVAPIYGSDDRVIFASDRMRDGLRHHYPQLDEYDVAPTVTGLWSLDSATGDLILLEHSPSGSFTPIVDSFGRVIFTRWDHLERDQQADIDSQGNVYGTFDYSSEGADATKLFNQRDEVFPEPRSVRDDLLNGTPIVGHSFNFFFPWMINQDGTAMETLNHVGRQEMMVYLDRAFSNDPSLVEFTPDAQRPNQNSLRNLFQIREDPRNPGLYFGTDAPEFETHAAGQLVTLTGAPTVNPDLMTVGYLTHPDTANVSEAPEATHSGLYRDPLPTSDGLLIAAHTRTTVADSNLGTRANPQSRYAFRLTQLRLDGESGFWVEDDLLTPGISKSVTYYDPDVEVTYSGPLWEVQPVEVRARSRPPRTGHAELEAPELSVFQESGVSIAQLKAFLRANDLAMIVMRNVTTRDDADRQQPFNLRVAESPTTSTTGDGGIVYNVAYLQMVQGDLIRGIGLVNELDEPVPGRRVLAKFLRDPQALANNIMDPSDPEGSVTIEADGSVAAFVPARRALSWQLTDRAGEPVVRERYWLSFQPGEIRTCASCHGLNREDQAGGVTPTNQPLALTRLLMNWKLGQERPEIAVDQLDNQSIRLEVRGLPGWDVLIEHSPDLSQWFPLGTRTLPMTGEPSLLIDHLFGVDDDRVFFRTRRQP